MNAPWWFGRVLWAFIRRELSALGGYRAAGLVLERRDPTAHPLGLAGDLVLGSGHLDQTSPHPEQEVFTHAFRFTCELFDIVSDDDPDLTS